jgi:uroporphyrinogen decarboxylase
MNKRELVWNVLHNIKADRVPVGFWLHYLPDELKDVFEDPSIRDANLAGHRKFYEAFQPDFLKIMTDGYFRYPNTLFNNAESVDELREVKPIGADHPWIREQVQFAKEVTGVYGKEVMTFYNVFSPSTYFKYGRHDKPVMAEAVLADFIEADKEAVTRAMGAVAEDIAALAAAIVKEGGADGIYYSTQDVADPRVDGAMRHECLAPSDFAVLESASRAGGFTILHVCSYGKHHNDVSLYADYPADAVNWAACMEKLPLGKGKALFGGKPVIGGFGNTVNDILYHGTKAAIEGEVDDLLREAGTAGVILGADCTIPRDIDLERLNWVRDRAARYGK